MGLIRNVIIGSIVGEALGSKKDGVIGALLQEDGNFNGAVWGGITGSVGEDKRNELDYYDEDIIDDIYDIEY